MKWIDRWVGLALCALLWPIEHILPARKSGKSSEILVIKFWGMGSIIMAGYLLKSLKKALPDSRITLLTLESNRKIAEVIGVADRIETLDISHGIFKVIGNIFGMMRNTFKARYDVALDLEYLTRFTALVTFASRAPARVGFYARNFWRGNFHNRKVAFNPYWHVRDNFMNQASAAGYAVEAPDCMPLEPGENGRAEAKELLEDIGVSGRYIIVNPNAGETSLERRWPLERFAALSGIITEKLDASVLVIGAENERGVAERVVDGASSERVFNVAGRTSVRGLIALLAGAEAVVSNDSGPLHIASHAGTKVVGLFGPETPSLWGPIGPDDVKIKTFFRNIDCSPCINIHNMKTVACLKEGAECLASISVEEVFGALCELLGRQKGQKARGK